MRKLFDIGKFDNVGAAFGTLFAEISICLYQTICAYHRGLDIKHYVTLAMPFVISGVVMFLILWALNLNGLWGIWILLIKIFIGAFVYLSLLFVFRKTWVKEITL